MGSFLFTLVCLVIILLQFRVASSVNTVAAAHDEPDYADTNSRVDRYLSKQSRSSIKKQKTNFLIRCSVKMNEAQYLEVLPNKFPEFENLFIDKEEQKRRESVGLPQLQHHVRNSQLKDLKLSFRRQSDDQILELVESKKNERLKSTCKKIVGSGSLLGLLNRMKKKNKDKSKFKAYRSRSLDDLLDEPKPPVTPRLQKGKTITYSHSELTGVYQGGYSLEIQEISSVQLTKLKQLLDQDNDYDCMKSVCQTTIPLPMPTSMTKDPKFAHRHKFPPQSPLLDQIKKQNIFSFQEGDEQTTTLKRKENIPMLKRAHGMRMASVPVLEVIVEMADEYGSKDQYVENEVFDDLAQLRREGSPTEDFSVYVSFIPPKGPTSLKKTKKNIFNFDFRRDPQGYVLVGNHGEQKASSEIDPPLYHAYMDINQHLESSKQQNSKHNNDKKQRQSKGDKQNKSNQRKADKQHKSKHSKGEKQHNSKHSKGEKQHKSKHSKGEKQVKSKHSKADKQQNSKQKKAEKQKSSNCKKQHLSNEAKVRINRFRKSGGSLSQVPLYDERIQKESLRARDKGEQQGQQMQKVSPKEEKGDNKSGHTGHILSLLESFELHKQRRKEHLSRQKENKMGQKMPSPAIVAARGEKSMVQHSRNTGQSFQMEYKRNSMAKMGSNGQRQISSKYRIKRGTRVSLSNLILQPPPQFRNTIMSH